MTQSLLQIHHLITRLEQEIGNGAQVRFSMDNGLLWMRVDWWDSDYHGQRVLSHEQLSKWDNEAILGEFIAECRYKYTNRTVK